MTLAELETKLNEATANLEAAEKKLIQSEKERILLKKKLE